MGFSFHGKVDSLGITAARDVEDTIFAPSVLVIANQDPVGIRGKRGFTGLGRLKEYGGVALAMPACMAL